MNIKVKRGRLRQKWAQVEKKETKNSVNYTITLNRNNAPMENAIALFHELLHVIFWEFLPFDNIDREERMIAVCEKSFKRHIKKYWQGKG